MKIEERYSILIHMVLSCLLCIFIEACSRHSLFAAFGFVTGSPLTFLYNAFIIFLTLIPVFFFKRRLLFRCIISFLWAFLGIVNGFVLARRVTPFGYTDLKLVGDLFSMTGIFTPFMTVLVLLFVILFLASIVYLYKKGPVFEGVMHRYIVALVLIACYFIVPLVTNYALNRNVIVDYFENIAQGYEQYGFVYGFTTSVVGTGMTKSASYSAESVEAILEGVGERMEKMRKEPNGDSFISPYADEISDSVSVNDLDIPVADPKKRNTPNIIVVLLETFCDPTEIRFLSFNEDPVPYFHYLQSHYSSGYFTVPVVGAGTANTEFEVLTGMSMDYFGTGEYPYKTILKKNSCESVASVLHQMGYGTYVVHNNKTRFYSRDNAFSKMGFDAFTGREFMNLQEYTPQGNWPTDDILREHVLLSLDDTENQSDLVYTITVQGHGPYPEEKLIENPRITVSGNDLTEEEINKWEYYANELNGVDTFIENLIADLEKRDEKSLVILWGDHLPTMDLTPEDMKSGSIFKTKYVTWNNFGMPKKDAELTSYQIMAHFLDELRIHEGTMFTYHQSYQANTALDQTEPYSEGLEMLQYDLLYGQRYAYRGKELYGASDLEYGLRDATIQNVFIRGNKLVIIGQNFTPFSKVFVNGDEKKKTQVSNRRIEIKLKNYEPEEGDEIVISQCSGKYVFRSSAPYIYKER